MNPDCNGFEQKGIHSLKRSILAILVVTIALAAVFSLTAETDASSGSCGKNLTWNLENGKLTISGSGSMYNYDDDPTPWGKDKNSITEIVVTGTPYNIGHYAFSGCSSLKSIDFGKTEEIGTGAFSNCVSLSSVVIPNSMKYIMPNAFDGCSSLSSVTIGSDVREIDDEAFAGCVSLKSVTIGDMVESIDSKAFAGCSSLSSVTFGKGLKDIRMEAFTGCTSLTTLAFPDSVKTILSSAFKDCSNLSSVTFGNGLIIVSPGAFSVKFEDKDGKEVVGAADLSGHTYKSVSKGVLRESNGAQKCGDDLTWTLNGTKLTISGTGPMYETVNAPWGTDITEVVFDGTPTTIGYKAFAHCNIKSMTIPDSVTRIENSAFQYSNIESVKLSDSLTYLGETAFQGCEKLASVKIPSNVMTIRDGAFYQCSSLKELDLGSVSYIADSAFAGCTSLTSVNIPEPVTTIEYGAFQYDNALTHVSFGSKLKELGNAFTIQFQDKDGKTVAKAEDLRGHTYEGTLGVLRETGDTPVPIHVTMVELDKSSVTLAVGKTLKLTAAVSPSDAADKSVYWETNNPQIATVDDNGNVKAVSAGTATITVTTHDEHKSDYCVVHVSAEPSPTPEPSGSDNTMLYVGVGIAIVVLAILALLFMRSRGKI